MAMGAKPAGARRSVATEDHEQEETRHHDLADERGNHRVVARGTIAVTIAGEPAGDEIKTGLARRDQREHEGAEYCADDLRHDVRHEMPCRKAAGNRQADTHRRIQMTSGNVTDGIGHRQDGKAECERNAHEADAEPMSRPGEAGGEHGAAAAAEHQPESAEELGCDTF